MTVTGHLDDKVHVPKEVKVTMKGAEVTVKGPKGTVTRDFSHPKVSVTFKEDHFHVECEYPRTKEKALVGTYTAHLKNMVEGANHGFEYAMKMVYSHFPMKIAVKGDKFIIENFLGEKAPRSAPILAGAKVTIKGAEVFVTAPTWRRYPRPPPTSNAPPRSGASTPGSSRMVSTSLEGKEA